LRLAEEETRKAEQKCRHKSIDKCNIGSKPASSFYRVYITSEKTERGETNTTQTQKKARKKERKRESKQARKKERKQASKQERKKERKQASKEEQQVEVFFGVCNCCTWCPQSSSTSVFVNPCSTSAIIISFLF
jgi:hypothetical protein